jgi:hypothetical protein
VLDQKGDRNRRGALAAELKTHRYYSR